MVEAIIVGAGHRSLCYAQYAHQHPDQFKITGVVDPLPDRRAAVQREFGLDDSMLFHDVDELCSKPKLADAIINGTMDELHVPTSIPLLEKGYHILLEKPVAISLKELNALRSAQEKAGKVVMICHVLRYAPFYAEIKKRILDGEIGKMITLSTAEYVSYHPFATCFVRGKWGNSVDCRTSMLMAKCCHDMDLVSWMTSGSKPLRVDSFGGLRWFCKENAPANAGTHCLLNCPLVDECDFSSKRMYLDHPERWASYVWPEFDYRKELNTPENRLAKLMEPANPHSCCAWKCNNDQVDRQSVIVDFENGCVATHQLIADTCRADRRIHIVGTEGEIEGFMSQEKFVLRKHDLRPGHDYSEEVIDVKVTDAAGHGGGDLRLVEDFVARINGEKPSISSTDLCDSVIGNQLVFAADAAMMEKRRIEDFDTFCDSQA